MRENKILKSICYILIPILALTVIIGLIYEIGKESVNNIDENDSTYFKTDSFLSTYMGTLINQTNNLIYRNKNYKSIQDENSKIFYVQSQNDTYWIKNFYFLILYNNLALTNVELTINTNSIEKIKEYILNANEKNASIINGNVESNSEIIANKALQYFDRFEITYYTINNTENEVFSSQHEYDIENNRAKEYHTVTINDLQIYTSYSEETVEEKSEIYLKQFVDQIKPYENTLYLLIPICSIIIITMLIYLIISIGYTKNKDEIDINDFDKIPIEIILIITGLIALIIFGISHMICRQEQEYNFIISILASSYFILYILIAVTFTTIIKRIKSKTVIKSSIIGRFCKWIFNILKRFKLFLDELTNSLDITIKLIVFATGYFLLLLLLILCMEELGVFIFIIITILILYKIIQKINCYKKIEEHLKQMYEGNNNQKLIPSEFTNDFQDIVKYINDISSGFENAIQEGIKSERLKAELITNVSHDLKTPLTSIINYIDLIKKEETENKKIREYIEILDNKSQRLKKLTEDLLEASKASSGSVKLNIEKINIGELIKQTTGEFEDKFKIKNLDIITSISDKEIFVQADNKYMYRIIENLFSNIAKYALDSSRVYIDLNKENDKVRIIIKNISKERLNITADELMQRFVRGDKSRSTEGSGLGISISKSLTEIQNGKFNLQVDGDLFKVELEFKIIE